MIDLEEIRASDLTDSAGALTIAGRRFGREYNRAVLWQWVNAGKLRAFVFEDERLVEREPGAKTQGRDLFFLRSDLEAMPAPKVVGRPQGAKNKPK